MRLTPGSMTYQLGMGAQVINTEAFELDLWAWCFQVLSAVRRSRSASLAIPEYSTDSQLAIALS